MTEVKEQRIIIGNNSKLVGFMTLIILIVPSTYCLSRAKFKKIRYKSKRSREKYINKQGMTVMFDCFAIFLTSTFNK